MTIFNTFFHTTRTQHCENARKGGNATKAKLGIAHYSKIGKVGAEVKKMLAEKLSIIKKK